MHNTPYTVMYIGLIQVQEEGWTEFLEGWQGCSEGNLEEQPCQHKENPVHLYSLTWINILIGSFGDISNFFLQILMFNEAYLLTSY